MSVSILPLLYDDLRTHFTSHKESDMYQIAKVKMEAYELSSVIGILEGDTRLDIPCTPPHERMWCEWEVVIDNDLDGDGGTVTKAKWCITIAAHVLHFIGEERMKIVQKLTNARSQQEVPDDAKSAVAIFGFQRYNWLRPAVRPGVKSGEIAFCNVGLVVYLCDKGLPIAATPISFMPEVMGRNLGIRVYDAMPDIDNDEDYTRESWVMYRPVVTALQLMHCRNIVGEVQEVPKSVQKQRQKEGKPRRSDYRVLKIEVPKCVKQRARQLAGDEDDDDTPKVRMHLCAGHYRHLTHERYRPEVRGTYTWVTEHLRGCAALGEVEGPRVLTPSRKGVGV